MKTMTKEEIKQAWEEVLVIHFHLLEKGIDQEGWYSNERNGQWFPIQGDDIKLYDFRNNNTEVRPKSLGILKAKDNIIGHMHYDFKNQKETFTPNPNFGKESKVKTAILSVEYKDHEVVVLTNRNGDTYTSKSEELMDFLFSCDDQSHITKLEARNKELEEALLQFINSTYTGCTRAELDIIRINAEKVIKSK